MIRDNLELNGPAEYGIRSTAVFCRSLLEAGLRRTLKGPRRPGWNWAVELGTQVLKQELAAAFAMPDVNEARRYLDSVVLSSPALSKVSVTPLEDAHVKGSWFVPKSNRSRLTLLYFHGGGYSFYPKSHANLIASVTLSAHSRTLALDYRLAPEHRFPAQLEDALQAYEWLLTIEIDPKGLVVAGDSAGGNLTLALLLAARDRQLPPPALAIALSPATDFEEPTELHPGHSSLLDNEDYDWISREMLVKWADWFCDRNQRCHPYISPVYADLHGLPPIYIQAGQAEILYDSIRAFAAHAERQGADIVLESWADMNHDFQMFGHLAPQSSQALERIGAVIAERGIGK